MLIAALVFASYQAVVLVVFGWFASRWLARQRDQVKQEISDALSDFLTAPDADTPSPLAMVVDQMALLLAARLIQQVKAMLAGVESGESKAEQLALMQEASAGSPWLGLIAGILPARIRNKLLKNPQMVGALSRMGQGGGGPAGGNHRETPGGETPKTFSL